MLSVADEEAAFDPEWYLARYPDVRESGIDPLAHWRAVGRRLGRAGAGANPGAPARLPCPVPETLRTLIAASGMLDEAWYRRRYDLAFPEDVLADYLHARGDDFARDPGPLFSARYYRERNPDTHAVDPLVHFAQNGLREGRPAFSPEKIAAFFRDARFDRLMPLTRMLDPTKPVLVLHWEHGNFFFTEISEYMLHLLGALGMEGEVRTDDAGVDPDKVNLLVVAPHEYGVYGPGRDWDADRAARAVYFNTEQWHTSWFTLALGLACRSRRVLDLNPASAAAFTALGFTAGFVPLLPLPGSTFDHPHAPLSPAVARSKVVKPLTYPEAFDARPYDFLFVGANSPRRTVILAELAPTLAPFDAFIHMPTFSGPVTPGNPDMLASSDFIQIARNTRILLNIHQGASCYFEWHRMVLSGMMEGCVVITEPADHVRIVQPNVHYIEATTAEMANLVPALLGTTAGRARLARIHANCRVLRRRVDAGELLLLP